MRNPWLILLVLTLARTSMGFQFQAIAAAGPVLTIESIISHTEFGTLIGLYLLPGTLIAIFGGWLGNRFGDKPVLIAGMSMMVLGGLLLSLAENYEFMLAGRLMSGIGAVLLNVGVTKMVTDWFAGYRIGVAMGVLITSWPLGIALVTLTTAPLIQLLGVTATLLLPSVFCAVSLILIAVYYTNAPVTDNTVELRGQPAKSGLNRYELNGVILSGLVWCLYNIALILPLNFGVDFLISRGQSMASSGTIVSLISWLVIPAIPVGAWIAERIGRPVTTMIASFIVIAVLIGLIPFTSYYFILFIMIGIAFGPAAGLIMALPSKVLRAENRAIGMGIFFTVYYLGMGLSAAVAGYFRDVTNNPASPLYIASGAILLAGLALMMFIRLRLNHEKALSID